MWNFGRCRVLPCVGVTLGVRACGWEWRCERAIAYNHPRDIQLTFRESDNRDLLVRFWFGNVCKPPVRLKGQLE
jgi:hypothetical protein